MKASDWFAVGAVALFHIGCGSESNVEDLAAQESPLDAAQFHVVQGSCTTKWSRSIPAGSRLASVGHVNDDKTLDFALGAPQALADGGQGVDIQVRSGTSGKRIYSAPFSGVLLHLAGAGDLNHDGSADLAVSIQKVQGACHGDICNGGGTGPAELTVLSGETHRALWTAGNREEEPSFGNFMLPLRDRNCDQRPDLLVSSSFPSPPPSPGRFYVLSGSNGKTLRTYTAPEGATRAFASTVALTSDLNGDGKADFIVSDPLGPDSAFGAGRVSAIASNTGAELWHVDGTASGSSEAAWQDTLGDSLVVAGDLNGDGVPDVVAGAHNHNKTDQGYEGKVVALNGKTGAVLWSMEGRRRLEQLGLKVAVVGDVNGDGVPDIYAAGPTPNFPFIVFGQGGRFAVLDGRTGAVLVDVESEVAANAPSDNFGTEMAALSSPRSRKPVFLVAKGTKGMLLSCKP